MSRSSALRVQREALPLFDEPALAPSVPASSATPSAMSSEVFLAAVRSFRDFGTETREWIEDGIPYLVNEFWTAGQRQAHSIHEVSYRACFKPQLPEFFIDRLTLPGDGVLDPFMGRGTTPVQAALMARRPLGNDVNPLSTLLTRPRLAPPPLAMIAKRLNEVSWERAGQVRSDLLAFYHPGTLSQICALREWLLREAPLDERRPDPATDWLRMVAINRLTGHSPGFFSVYTLPPNQATSVTNQLRINVKRNQVPPLRDVKAVILKKTRQLLKDGLPPAHPPAMLGTGPAARMAHIPDGSANLVVTSPPFLDIVQYAQDNWLRGWFAGIDADAVEIAMHRTEVAWEAMVRAALTEMARIVRPGGHVAFEVGEVRNGKVLLERAVWRAAEGLPFDRLAVIVNQQEFTKTANCWGVDNNAKGTNTNRIVLLRRH
ncbi:DNA methylase [Humitalea rosea]|uniref:DNA methylase n=1 Tax=Humitalea rosea TaxID=990373 RepID=A0A2W7I7S8_9PROT|nr:DNA methylase [Humitalea rosea]